MSLIRKITHPSACEIYMCRNFAKYEIGHSLSTQLNMHVCETCLEEIMNGAKAELETETKAEIPPEAPAVEATESGSEDVIISEEKEVYTCKKCGQTFKKPEELNAYRSHTAKCGK